MEKERITIETIEKLADFSRLNFSIEEKEVLRGEVSGIIEMLDKCAEVDATQSAHFSCVTIDDLREDVVEESLDSNEVFSNAPMSKNGYYGVPGMVE